MKNVKANVLQQYEEEKGDYTGKSNKSRQDNISRGGLNDPASHKGSVGHTKSVNANKRIHDSELEILSQQSQKQQNVNNQLRSSAEQINQQLQNPSVKNSTSKNGQNTQHSNDAKPPKQQIQSSSNSSTGSVNRLTHKPSSQTTKKAPARVSKEPESGLNMILGEEVEETQTQTVPNRIINQEGISESEDEDKGTHQSQTAIVNPAINKPTQETKKKNVKPRVSNTKEPKQRTLQDTIEKFDKNNKNSQKPKKPNSHATSKQTLLQIIYIYRANRQLLSKGLLENISIKTKRAQCEGSGTTTRPRSEC
ncbi:hypothetical protein OXYTRIMIC_786 [Oxytricha trifallax]|uniref:Uncharacterized protein n=1 Tax=Oxytricha trifallax TaxID=1172189 RepID=A0A073HZX6_9SPIT|nr:hypothetical protein OXYTRIMIC_786 [Oxytricha trifallax]